MEARHGVIPNSRVSARHCDLFDVDLGVRVGHPIYVNGSCGSDANTGQFPECNAPNNTGPKLTIQAAINAASALTEDVVIVADGTYAAPSGGITLNKNITVKSSGGKTNCTIAGSSTPSRLLLVTGTTNPGAVIEGFTFTGGRSEGSGSEGGAIKAVSRVTISQCRFTDNRSDISGGAIWSLSRIFIDACEFDDNEVETGWGGAIAVADNGFDDLPAELRNCVITNNRGTLGGGGVASFQKDVTMIGCIVSGNRGGQSFDPRPRGGGIAVVQLASSSEFNLVNSIIQDNGFNVSGAAWRGLGGGMAIDNQTSNLLQVKIVNCLFVENGDPDESTETTKEGGGLHNRGGALSIDNCTFVGNGAVEKGAAYFEENVANSRTIEIDNSIFWDNFVPTIAPPEQIHLADLDNTIHIRHCDVDGGEDAIVGAAPDVEITSLLNADPLFAMSDPDHPYRLRFNSPCRDRASSTLLPADEFDLDGDNNLSEPIPFDIEADDEHARNVGCNVDIGAYEVQTEPGCPGINPKVDIAGGTDGFPDGQINVNDLLAVVGNWDATGLNYADIHTAEHPCGDGVVNVNDLLAVISQWGPCGVPEAPPDDIDDCFDYCESLSGQQWQDCLSRCFAAYCSAHPEDCD